MRNMKQDQRAASDRLTCCPECARLGRRELTSCLQHTGRIPAGKISEKLTDSLNASFQAGSAAKVSLVYTSF